MSRTKSEDAIGAPGRPFTGAEYLESLRDGREVYIYGERVADVTTHPAFRNTARSLARLYDALHDPKSKDVLTAPTDTGSGGFTRVRARTSWASGTRSRPGHACPMAGWGARPITRPR
jgi:4-hydroxyphenylacetate 3-monooxygenase